MFKLNFDGSRIQDISTSGWVIRDTNGTIKMTVTKHLDSALIITAECITLRDVIQAARLNDLSNLKIEEDSKIIIDCFNKKISLPSSIILLMENI